MQYDVILASAKPDLEAIRDALCDADPAAVADFDALNGVLRISASLPADALGEALAQSGHPVPAGQVFQQPSTCCGGCGG